MPSEFVTVILGQFSRPPDPADLDSVYNRAQWLAGHLFREHRPSFYIPPVLRRERGEVLGLLKRPEVGYRVCTQFNEEIFPGSIRFAIVWEALEIPGSKRPDRELVGKTGERARHLLGKARSVGWSYVFDLGKDVPLNQVLTEMASLVHSFRGLWSVHQNQVIRLYQELGRQKFVAERLGISQQAVSDILKRAHWKEIRRAERMIDEVLKGI